MSPSSKQVIFPGEGAKPIGPYSPAIRFGHLVFTSGQIGLDPETGKLVSGGVAPEARQALDNIGTLLKAAGVSFDNVVKTTLFLIDIGDFSAVNEIYAQYFGKEPPARSTFQVAALPGGALVEIEAIAHL
ncbi:MAG TPA: RidA family protein [Anaerolineales bacterium]|nr:RidA family protein [Anaerolineales bacterium]